MWRLMVTWCDKLKLVVEHNMTTWTLFLKNSNTINFAIISQIKLSPNVCFHRSQSPLTSDPQSVSPWLQIPARVAEVLPHVQLFVGGSRRICLAVSG